MKILIKSICSLDDSCLLNHAKPDFIDEVRWEKIQSLKVEKDKLRSLASGYLLYKMYMELGIENPRYAYSENGKPYIAGFENIAFNLSHSGDYAVLAYDRTSDVTENGKESAAGVSLCAVGVDIQQIRPLHAGMKKRILHEKEQVPEGLSLEEENVYLNRIWCIKESYVKMTGEGLALDFRKILIDFDRCSVAVDGRPQSFFAEYDNLQGYILSVCVPEALKKIPSWIEVSHQCGAAQK